MRPACGGPATKSSVGVPSTARILGEIMYAVVEQGGKQYRVSEGDTIEVDRLEADEGSEVELGRVLLVGGDKVKVGAPTVKGAKVTAKIVSHHLGDKVETFKYRPRKRYRKLGGFRASLTKLEITGIKA